MFSSLPTYYWDSCVMLSYINGAPDRMPDIEALLSRSGKDCRLVTSVLSIVEVAFAKREQDSKALSEEQAAAIAKLWEPNSPISTSEFYQLIAEDAQVLIREAMTRGWSLKSADAIHLATADRLKVVEFHTYDKPLEKYSEITKTKFKICAPVAEQLMMILDAKEKEQNIENSAVVPADDSGSIGDPAREEKEGEIRPESKPEEQPKTAAEIMPVTPKEDGKAKPEEIQPEEPKAAGAAIVPIEPEKPKPTAKGGLDD